MFSPQRPVHHHRIGQASPKWARPYGQTKSPKLHPRKAYPVPPPTPFDIRANRRAKMQKENGNADPASPPVTPRRRKPRTEGTDYPPPEAFKNMRYLGTPPRKPNAPPRLVGNQIYIDRDDAVQPLVEELKALGPLDEEDQVMLQRLSEIRAADMMREAYHREAVIVEHAIEEARRDDRHERMRLAGEEKRRLLREQREQVEKQQKEAEEKRRQQKEVERQQKEREWRFQRKKELEELRLQREQRKREAAERQERECQEAIRNAAIQSELEKRRMENEWRLAQKQRRRDAAEAQRRMQLEAEALRKKQREDAALAAQIEEIERLHRLHLQRVEEQRRQDQEMRQRAAALEQEREQQMRQEQERLAREAEEAQRAQEEQERLAREARERAVYEQQVQTCCELYEGKWAELKSNHKLANIVQFDQFPFPVLCWALEDPAHITLERVREFFFHPFRGSNEGKERKDILKIEVLRWHPDKFDNFIRPKVAQADWEKVKEAAGLVARCVTTLMAEA